MDVLDNDFFCVNKIVKWEGGKVIVCWKGWLGNMIVEWRNVCCWRWVEKVNFNRDWNKN